MNKFRFTCIAIFFFLAQSSGAVAETSSVDSEHKIISVPDKKFSLSELENLLNGKDYTDSVKVDLYRGYLKVRNPTLTTLDIKKVIKASIPTDVKKSIFRKTNFMYPNSIDIEDVKLMYDWSKNNDCEACLENAYFIGKNKNKITINLKIKKMIEHNIKNTYLIIPMLMDGQSISHSIYFFLEEKGTSIFFAKNDSVTFTCKNSSYHTDDDTTIFWNCGLVFVNGNSPESENSILNEIRMKNTYTQKKRCMKITDVQKKLNYINIDTGKNDGRFGYKTFLGLLKYQSQKSISLTGDIDEATCLRLEDINIPEPVTNTVESVSPIKDYQPRMKVNN